MRSTERPSHSARADAFTRRSALRLSAAIAGTALLPRTGRAAVVDFIVIGRDGWLFNAFDDVRRFDPAKAREATGVINDAVGLIKRKGIDVVITVTPAKSRIYRDFLPPDIQFGRECEARYSRCIEMLRAPGTLVPDLAAVLLEARKANSGEPYFLKADSHWNAMGAELAASEVARQVKAHITLPASPQGGTQLGGLVTVRQGRNDLSDGLPQPMASQYPPERYAMHEVIQPAGPSALVQEDLSDVLVVGNSFMQPKYNFAAMLSNQIGRPVGLEWKVHQNSPYKTLLDTLAGDRRAAGARGFWCGTSRRST